MRSCLTLSLLGSIFLLAGCGKPPAGGPPPGEHPVLAVVAKVNATDFSDDLQGVGQVESVEEVQLTSEVDATLLEARVEDGAKVEKGQVLFVFDPIKAQTALAQAQSRVVLAKAERERTIALRASNTVPQQDLDRADAELRSAEAMLALAEDNLRDATVSAPFAGVLETRMVSPGQYCSRGQALGRLVQTDPVEIAFSAPERYVGFLRDGLGLVFRTDARPDEAFPASVSYLAPTLDTATRTLRVKARIANPSGRLKPGMFGTFTVSLGKRPGVMLIPESAVNQHGDNATVFVMNAEGKAELRPVTTGRRTEGAVEIAKGLKPGEIVVVEGHQKMRPGSMIMVSPKSEAFGVTPPPPAPADGAKPAGQALPKETPAEAK